MKAKKNLTYALIIIIVLNLSLGCNLKASSIEPKNTFAGKIKIGGNFELTGKYAEFGKKGENGAKMAIDEINAQGGVLGKQIEYIGTDNKSEAEESIAVTTKLVVQDKVIGIIGPMTSANTLAAVPVITDYKVPLIAPTGSNAKITVSDKGLNTWVFRACFVDAFQGEAMADFAIDTLKVKKAAIIFDPKDAYAKGLAEAFQKKLEAAGGQVIATEQYRTGDIDFRPIIAKVQVKNPDMIFVPGYYNEAGLIIRQAREAKITVPILGGDGWGTGPILEIAGAEALNNTYLSDHIAADDPSLTDFAVAYKTKYNESADSFAILAYDAVKLLCAAMEAAGSTDTEKVRQALETTTGFKGLSGVINVDPVTHNPKKSVAVLKYVNGQKVFAARIDPK